MIDHRRLGRTELQVCPLGFGGAPIGLLATDAAQAAGLLATLMDQGVNLLDTAAGYADSEIAIGRALGTRRHEIVLVSKCGNQVDDLDGEPWTADYVARSVDRSLRRLQTDHLDVMLLHSCPLEVLQQGEVIDSLVQARVAGKIGHAGYAGDGEAATYAAGLDDIEVIEMTVNFCDQANLGAPLETAQKNDVGVITKRSLANAAWDNTLQRGFYRQYAKPYIERFQVMGLDLADLQLRDPSIIDWPDVALRFTLTVPGVSAGVFGTTNPDNALANMVAAGRGPLSPPAYDHVVQTFAAASSTEPWPALR